MYRKKFSSSRKLKENGQTLAILVLSLTVFLAFLALALDGGYTWAQRRQAQAAADAGALAGTRQLCSTEGTSSEKIAAATAAAQDYAVVRNGATTADVSTSLNPAWVEVTTHVVFNTFLAHLLGRPTIDAQATARAACFTPSTGEGVLPIAWSCKPPAPGSPSTSEDCDQLGVTETEYYAGLSSGDWLASPPSPELYLIMDSASFDSDLWCQEDDPDSDMICDWNDDGKIDIFGAGSRSWLDLDGGGNGANQLNDWIANGYSPEITTHTWLPDSPGTKAVVFDTARTKIGTILILPVFDMFCQGDMTGSDCATRVHPLDPGDPTDIIVNGGGQNSINVHIISFSGFGITCVRKNNSDHCPLFDKFEELNPGITNINSFKTIEGVFIRGFISGIGGGEPGPPDAGVYVLLLDK